MRTLRRFAWIAMLAIAPAVTVVGLTGADAAMVVGQGGAIVSPRAASSATVARLSRLHHAAAREVELGRLAQLSANRPETRVYGGRLVADFGALDGRIRARAQELGVDAAGLERTYAGENTAALAREKEDLDRLGAMRGDALDRRFWVIVAQDQLAAADMLPAARSDPQLEPLVVELGRQLDLASHRALVAARPFSGPPRETLPPPAVPSPDVPAAPVATPGPPGVGSSGAAGALVPPAR
jgi:hypothetical protein